MRNDVIGVGQARTPEAFRAPPSPHNRDGQPSGRWTALRKLDVVRMFAAGELTTAEIEARYGVTVEELDTWRERVRDEGLCGLMQSSIQGRHS